MKKIYFVRHSIRDTTNHSEQAPLSNLGQQLALSLATSFDSIIVEAIFSSPYRRAQETILPIAQSKNLSLQLVDALHERQIGTWLADFDSFTKKQWEDKDYKLDSGESLNEVKSRILLAFQQIMSQDFGTVIISGHGTSLAILFHYLTHEKFGYDDFRKMNMPDVYLGLFDEENRLFSLTKPFD